jgi:hypothetical protein
MTLHALDCILAIVLVLSPAILYGLLLVLVAVWRSPCPACGRRGLKMAGGVKATILVNGKRAGDHWSYYVCQQCGAGFKWHRGNLSLASEGEIRHYCGSQTR